MFWRGNGRRMATNLPPCVISNRDPVSVLMEHGQTREVTVDFTECTRTGPAHNSRFHTAALVNGKRFAEGHGTSKKNAKKIAAELALDRLYKVASRNLKDANQIAAENVELSEEEGEQPEPLSPAQKIKAMAKGVFELAEETQMIYFCKEKVVAAFLMERNGQQTVVALGTGNRSVLYQNLKSDGTCIIQAHAEIVARRAFVRFLYNELDRFVEGEKNPIFTRSNSGKLSLVDGVKFHLYISRPPCGDASAFPTIGSKDVRSKALRKQGVLRTLVADGEGAIPTDSVLPAGHNGEERLRVMTCSDKICRWNVVGVQGALLSHIMEPIYLSSVVIGSYSGDQKEHVPRAVFGRLKTGALDEKIYNPYMVNSPSLYYPEDHDLDNYALNKSRQYSVIWTIGDEGVEVIDGIFGTKISGPTDMPYSAISKKHFFTLFHQICTKFGRRDLLGKSYLQIKDKASEYRRNQDVLYQHFVSKKLGTWCSVSENYDVDNFYL
ncbi:double-stranded RNA-specific adenosine deaminase isoform X2 [Patella vulgata]|uniref:double-stranded RNA-specific adenosine deaminase isoform X2 n=1 Tax=Patella vulgata TaxID=6465 RepID=UPI00217F6820|nr:double-stranded RNA-specific adenosine deaminase isoform X2 [Patella vulgata]